jgi:hypothetical protein
MTSHDATPYEVQRQTWAECAHYDKTQTGFLGADGINLDMALANSYREEWADLYEDMKEVMLALPRSDAQSAMRSLMDLGRMIAPELVPARVPQGEWTHDGATGGPITEEKPAAEVAAEAKELTEALEQKAKDAAAGLPEKKKPDAVEAAVSGNRRQVKQADK